MFLFQILRQLPVLTWIRGDEPSLTAAAGMFVVILIAVGGADLVRLLVRAATR
jgi:hypothetical protein